MKYQTIQRCRGIYPVRLMCRCLQVSTSGYYGWLGREVSPREQANRHLCKRIRNLHKNSQGVFGVPRITEGLKRSGLSAGKNRVARLMMSMGLQGIPRPRRPCARVSRPRPPRVTNHLNRNFTADVPNQKWATDITQIRTMTGWLYLCVVLDMHHKPVIGWSMGTRPTQGLAIQAVRMALWQRPDRQQPTIIHSDHGSQFTSHAYQQFVRDHGFVPSMSAVGHCGDNAAVEGFFGMLKRERTNRRRYKNIAEARQDLFDYIERFYNGRIREKKGNGNYHSLGFPKPSVVLG